MKGIILYHSNYGSTEQYARWLSEEVGFPVVEARKAKSAEIAQSDVVVIGSPIIAGQPSLAKWTAKRCKTWGNGKVFFFAVSNTAADSSVHQTIIDNSFPGDLKNRIKYFALRGRMVPDKLSGFHKFMIRMGKKVEKDPVVRERMGQPTDYMDRDTLKPLVDAIRS